jgi:L-threonylcarbamoyladenylate synthase
MPKIISSQELDNRLGEICKELQLGHCIGLPTETVYGLAADATNGQAVARIFEMKGRPKFNPLIIHVANLDMAEEYGTFNALARQLADAFWPGPLTLVVPRRTDTGLSELVSAGLGTVGIRCPKGLAQEIIASFGRPLAAPSANKSGKISPTDASHVAQQFEGTDLLIADNGACEVGLESTIAKVEDEVITILRPGLVTADMIQDATGKEPEISKSQTIEAPGMMKSHYAPNANVKLNCNTVEDGAAFLAFGQVSIDTSCGCTVYNLSKSGDLREAAANLYLGLKTLDETGTDMICVSQIPLEGLGIAINDRLQRASAPRKP